MKENHKHRPPNPATQNIHMKDIVHTNIPYFYKIFPLK